MIQHVQQNRRDLFRLAWAQTRVEVLRELRQDINATGKREAAERRCLEIPEVDSLSLREAVTQMCHEIAKELSGVEHDCRDGSGRDTGCVVF